MNWTLAPALKTLLAEVNAAYPGRDKRTDGTISGYPGAQSSHNYNAQGFVCALDITTGDYNGGISKAEGQHLAEQVRLALKIQPRGIPAYPIHYMEPPYVDVAGPKIATAGTDWEWEPYGFPGSDPHTSHLHISADWDIYTGQTASGLADYMTTAPWGITSKDQFPMEFTKAQLLQIVTALKSKDFGAWLQTTLMNAAAPSIDGRRYTLAQHLLGTAQRTVKTQADVEALKQVVGQLATQAGTPIDYARIDAGVTAALAAGIKIEGTITTGGIEE